MTSRADRRQTKGRYADPLAAQAKLSRAPEGQHGQVIAPTQEAIREAIEAGKCPWCGRGPYKVLASHVTRLHGIDCYELRELAGYAKRASICDPDVSQEIADRQREAALRLGTVPPKPKPGRKLSSGGLESRKRYDETRRKPRQACVVCGSDVPYKPSQPNIQTCGGPCLTALRKQRAEGPRFETCKQGHPLEGDNVILRPRTDRDNPKRVCRECEQGRNQRRRKSEPRREAS